tara:strand:- start:5961 stop:6188 length:228 start_codon:yes stop_codon:yes gene_type:complete
MHENLEDVYVSKKYSNKGLLLGIDLIPYDTLDKASVLAKEAIQKEEDKNIFNAIWIASLEWEKKKFTFPIEIIKK